MASFSRRRRTFLLIGIGLFLIAASAGFYWIFRIHGFSARRQPTATETLLARHIRHLAIPAGARRLKNPLQHTASNIAEARDHFADTCAVCHANNGNGKTRINSGLYPPAPDLRAPSTQDLSDGEIFYIIKNGIRFTGMPGWGGDDEDNWLLVLFIRHLRNLTPQDLGSMNEINGLENK